MKTIECRLFMDTGLLWAGGSLTVLSPSAPPIVGVFPTEESAVVLGASDSSVGPSEPI